MAFRARAVGRIEAERARLNLRDGNAAIGAGEFFGIHMLFAADDGDRNEAACELQRCFDGLFEPLRNARLQQQAVDHDFYGVILAAVERRRFVQIYEVSVNSRADVAFFRILLQFLFVFAFASAHDGRENHHAVIRLERQHGLNNLLGGLPGDGLAAIRAVRRADGAVNHAQIIVNFGDRAHGGAGRARGGLLLDGDGGRKPFDRIHIGALHLIEELARVGR